MPDVVTCVDCASAQPRRAAPRRALATQVAQRSCSAFMRATATARAGPRGRLADELAQAARGRRARSREPSHVHSVSWPPARAARRSAPSSSSRACTIRGASDSTSSGARCARSAPATSPVDQQPLDVAEVGVHVAEQPVRAGGEERAEQPPQLRHLRARGDRVALLAVELDRQLLARQPVGMQRQQREDLGLANAQAAAAPACRCAHAAPGARAAPAAATDAPTSARARSRPTAARRRPRAARPAPRARPASTTVPPPGGTVDRAVHPARRLRDQHAPVAIDHRAAVAAERRRALQVGRAQALLVGGAAQAQRVLRHPRGRAHQPEAVRVRGPQRPGDVDDAQQRARSPDRGSAPPSTTSRAARPGSARPRRPGRRGRSPARSRSRSCPRCPRSTASPR